MSQVIQPSPRKTRPQPHESTQPVHPAAAQVTDAYQAQPVSVAGQAVMLTAVVGPLIGVAAAVVLLWQLGWMGWGYLAMMIGGWYLTGLGITIGFHRLLSHQAFEANRWVSRFWVSLGTLSVEGSPISWSAIHRGHHQHTDREGDPHSPVLHGDTWWDSLKGFWHSHTGWLFTRGYSQGYDPQYRKRYVPDLMEDPFLLWIDRNYVWWILASLAIPTAIGGLVTLSWMGAFLGFVWGGLVRIFITQQFTWAINSVCHVFGRQDFEAHDDSRNNVVFGFISHGEGWHNNHHAFPTSARHGLKWWQFDLSWILIRSMQRLGWVWNVKLPSDRALASRKLTK